jgi:mRNA interferase HigB
MKLINRKKILDFAKKNTQAKKPLAAWIKIVKNAKWEKSADVKSTFASVDNPRGNEYIFNISGNKFRLVAVVIIKSETVTVDKVMTHNEYDRWCKKQNKKKGKRSQFF